MNDDVRDETVGLTAGHLLAQARQARNLSVEEVAAQLKLSSKSVLAIEVDRHESLPGLTFVRGFARNYARLVGLDAAEVLALLPAIPVPEPEPAATAEVTRQAPVAAVIPTARPRRAKPLLLTALALFILGGAGAIITRSGLFAPPPRLDTAGSGASAGAPAAISPAPAAPVSATSPAAPVVPATIPQTAAPAGAVPAPTATVPVAPTAAAPVASSHAVTAAPASAAPAASTAPATVAPASAPAAPVLPDMSDATTPAGAGRLATAGAGRLEIHTSGSTWITVRDAGGHTLWSGMMTAGGRRAVTGRPPLRMVVGNAPAARILYNGRPVDLAASTSGKVARMILE